MKPQLFAVLTAICWGVGSYLEKKGLHLGTISPQMGLTIRTASALVILGAVSFPQWKTLAHAGGVPILYFAIGGGLFAGALGTLFFYVALNGAPLTQVMPIAFTSPLVGVLLGALIGGEPLTVKTILGTLLTVGGIILLTI